MSTADDFDSPKFTGRSGFFKDVLADRVKTYGGFEVRGGVTRSLSAGECLQDEIRRAYEYFHIDPSVSLEDARKQLGIVVESEGQASKERLG